MLPDSTVRKVSMLIVVLFLAVLLAPAASFAYESARIYYNPQTGTLSGTVYVNDPSKVKLTVTDSAYNTFDLAYKSTSEYTTYDDRNNVIKLGYFGREGLTAEPWKISLSACVGNPIGLIKHTYSPQTIVFEADDNFATGAYRTTGKQHFTDYPAEPIFPRERSW